MQEVDLRGERINVRDAARSLGVGVPEFEELATARGIETETVRTDRGTYTTAAKTVAGDAVRIIRADLIARAKEQHPGESPSHYAGGIPVYASEELTAKRS